MTKIRSTPDGATTIAMTQYRDNKESCPKCGAELQGESIPEASQHLFGATHFSRKIGLYDHDRDRTTHYMCPDCNGKWRV